MNTPSNCHDIGGFDDVAHEAGRIPIWRVWLRDTVAIGAADQHAVLTGGWQCYVRLPLPKSVFSFVLAELRLVPALAAVDREIDACHAAIAPESDAAQQRGRTSLHLTAGRNIRDEGSGTIRLIGIIFTPISPGLMLACGVSGIV